MTEEIWKDIAGYEGKYQVSNLGRVKSLHYNKTNKERLLTLGDFRGYLHVGLSKYSHKKMFYIHRLVAQAFIENPYNFPQVNHKDEDKTNNCVDNLEWCTAKYNSNYGTSRERMLITKKLRNKKTAPKEVLQFTKDGKFVKEYCSTHEAYMQTNINRSQILYCCKNRKGYETAGGYIWKYKNND